ncbi:bestrophin-1 domain protein [Necator americanus]|uniref:Bestrophin homolog n=1 Tax=Necator americanus TaxID=51031 RepID=W2SXE4_NECAM|nr:bestrophin-1 domain protein [Necator americanus]ETN73307.1 bestrophin-1 domain protein [Necator americanus]
MTLNYHRSIATSKPWTFLKLLFVWKASIWKAVYLELLSFLIVYGIISAYRSFEAVVRFFDNRLYYIPMELVLGFFCTQAFNRWTKQVESLGYVDSVALMTALYLRGNDEQARIYRRSIVRYCELIQVLVFRDISMRVRRRFPTLDTVVAAGFMMPHEKELFESYNDKLSSSSSKYWIPANWAFAITQQAWEEGNIESPYYRVVLQEEIKQFRTKLAWVFNYDWVPLPLIYPQVICLVVHFYFIVCLLSRQTIISDHVMKGEIDTYSPVMTSLQFVFYMGWLKVIEALLNPYGEDDDDFETNFLIDRNIAMYMRILFEMKKYISSSDILFSAEFSRVYVALV